MTKVEALARHLECETDEIDSNDGNSFDYRNGRKAYLVLTDEEADKLAKQDILDSLWAFNPSFLESHMSDVTDDMIKTIQEACEDATPVLLRLLDDKEHFVKDAIMSDGRGHFLSRYDGEEHEVGEYLIYRTN